MLCHGVLCIFLTTPHSYAAAAFSFGQYEKLLRYRKLPRNFPRLERCGGLSTARVCDVHELVTKHPRFPLQIRQHPIAILLFVRLLSCVNVCRTIPQHAVDQPSQLMRGRRHRFGCPEPVSPPTPTAPQGYTSPDRPP